MALCICIDALLRCSVGKGVGCIADALPNTLVDMMQIVNLVHVSVHGGVWWFLR